MKNSPELYKDYKLQHKLQAWLETQNNSRRIQLRSLYYCNKKPINCGYPAVDVVVTSSGGNRRAHFSNLYRCKSLWACPHCAAYGLNRHRDKITAIIEHWRKRGYWACMVTYTVPHNARESCYEVYKRLKDCKRSAHALPTYLPRSKGSITSTEFTYNDATGWHPHFHILYFIPKANWYLLPEAFEKIRQLWARAIVRIAPQYTMSDKLLKQCCFLSLDNKGAPRKVTNGDYIAKELAKIRRGNHKLRSVHPFELLETGDPRDFDLFFEYACATKGDSRIHYYRGLQKGVDFTEAYAKKKKSTTDPMLMEVVCSFTKQSWSKIMDNEFATGVNHRRRILICACIGGLDRIWAYCLLHQLPLPEPPLRQYTEADRRLA